MSANTAFQSVDEKGWRRGFANLLRHESATWWRTRRWWINILIWLVIANGTLFAMLSTSGPDSGVPTTPEQRLTEATMVFMVMAGIFGTVGAIIAMQGSVIDEKKSGTAAWIMSKPASRPAFVLAKLVANTLALLIIVLVVQCDHVRSDRDSHGHGAAARPVYSGDSGARAAHALLHHADGHAGYYLQRSRSGRRHPNRLLIRLDVSVGGRWGSGLRHALAARPNREQSGTRRPGGAGPTAAVDCAHRGDGHLECHLCRCGAVALSTR
ncbi:MAG: ABC transporter permease [Anaerolineae bacterium]|nr:ABC transporter permease [Anaerolineae bacterium]